MSISENDTAKLYVQLFRAKQSQVSILVQEYQRFWSHFENSLSCIIISSSSSSSSSINVVESEEGVTASVVNTLRDLLISSDDTKAEFSNF